MPKWIIVGLLFGGINTCPLIAAENPKAIMPDDVPHLLHQSVSTEVIDDYKHLPKTFQLHKDGQGEESPVATVQFYDDGQVVFTLKTVSTKLDLLTGADLEKLWGTPRQVKLWETFDLYSDSNSERNIFHIDVFFKEGKLNQYRLRGLGIGTPKWISV